MAAIGSCFARFADGLPEMHIITVAVRVRGADLRSIRSGKACGLSRCLQIIAATQNRRTVESMLMRLTGTITAVMLLICQTGPVAADSGYKI